MTKGLRVAWQLTSSIVTGASMLLCIAASLLWIRTHYVGDEYFGRHSIRFGDRRYSMFSQIDLGIGQIWTDISINPPRRPVPPRPPPPPGQIDIIDRRQIQNKWKHHEAFALVLDAFDNVWHGFLLEVSWNEPGRTGVRLLLPFWAIVVASAIAPAFWGIRRYRRPVAAAGMCGNCDYNLTANTSGVCPESGMPPVATAGTNS